MEMRKFTRHRPTHIGLVFSKQSTTHRGMLKCVTNAADIGARHPTLGDETLLRNIQVEFVECVKNRLQLEHLYLPAFEVERGRVQNAIAMLQRYADHSGHIGETRHNRAEKLDARRRTLGAIVDDGSAKALGNFMDACAKLIAGEEEEKNRLLEVVSLYKG